MSSSSQTDFGLLKVYSSLADELRSRYRRISDLFRHGPSIGRSREVYLADILRRCLPSTLDVCHGAFYVPGFGASSEQDILIVSTEKYPPIEQIGEFGIYYRDSIAACIEVKSRLTRKELKSAINMLVRTKKNGPGLGSRYVLFAYETKMSPQEILDEIPLTEDFFDYRPHLIVVLGAFVIARSEFQSRAPHPHFVFTAYKPKDISLDLTLLELIDTLLETQGRSPIVGLHDKIRSHFEPVASRKFICPVERPGTAAGTNLD